VDAVLGVDLEAGIGPGLVVQHLVDAGRAVEPRRLAIFRQVDADGNGWVQQLQMGRLFLGVVGVGDEDR
jgi:hypothetical protein